MSLAHQPQPSTAAREAYAWATRQWPRDDVAERRLKAAADAEFETDVEAMRSTAEFCERLAVEWTDLGKPLYADENRAKAARYRRLIAEIEGAAQQVAA